MTPGQAVLFTVVLLALLGVWALVRRSATARNVFDTVIAEDYTPPSASDTPPPAPVVLPDGFTCLSCEENPALPDRVWCAVCAPVSDALPAEPIGRGGLEGSIARHPAGKQKSGEER
jgi:hypothetical protein